MLALAGDFGATEGAFPEPSPFVGSRRCGECHPRIYREQQGESRHAQTLRFGEGLKDVPLPPAPVPDPVIKSISHGFTRKGVDQIELQSRIENRVFRAIVEYAVGSGRHGITMIAKDEEGSRSRAAGLVLRPRPRLGADQGNRLRSAGCGRPHRHRPGSERRSITVSPATRRGFARSGRSSRVRSDRKARTTESAASDATGRGSLTPRRPRPATPSLRLRSYRERRLERD